jgi:4-hydroxy-4-methyl-2-oxoglutarate aldolase
MVADDDGVLCVPRADAKTTRKAADARVLKEAESRAAYLAGELSLDRNRLRGVLADLGVKYLTAAAYEAGHGRD